MVTKAIRNILTTKDAKAAVRQLQGQLYGMDIPIENAYIFGSYARGNAGKDSDIDVAFIISHSISKKAKKKLEEIPWIAKQIHIKLEPHILSDVDFENPLFSIVHEIKKNGIRIL